MNMLWDILLDALVDTLKLIPFLLLAYLLMEYLENRAGSKLERAIQKVGNWGPAVGAALGCVPQCGFSATCANLYAAGVISRGTLLAVFLATSDEALPVLVGLPEGRKLIAPLLLGKVAVALVAGFAVDFVIRRRGKKRALRDLCEHCGCSPESGILRPALWHTTHIALFILVLNILLGAGMTLLGQNGLRALLLDGSVLQPMLAALVGLIPNCAASVMLTQLYLAGALSFGSLMAGLCSSAGIGLAVLVRMNGSKRENLEIIFTLYGVSVAVGLLMQAVL